MSPPFAVFINDTGLFAGRGRLLLEIMRTLCARGHRVDVLAFGPSRTLADRLPAGVRLVDLSRPWLRLGRPGPYRARGVYLALPALIGYLRRERPATVLGSSVPPNVTALLARRLAGTRTPVVLRQSNVHAIPGDDAYGGVRRRGRDRFVRALYPGADAAVAVSDGVADNVARATGLPAARVRTVYPGLPPETADWADAPASHPWPGDGGPPVVLNVARYVAKKDQATLLRAFARVVERREARLLIRGDDGPERPALERLAGELGIADRVDLAGYDPNPFAHMARADVFVLSSISEGMPNVVLEALCCGCPVVSTDCPSGPREMLADGAHGALVPMRDPEALAAAIVQTLDAPPDPAALRARAAAFSIDRQAARYADVLEGVAAPARAAPPGADAEGVRS